MKKLFILPCVLSAVFFLGCFTSISVVFAGEDEENVAVGQTEPTEQVPVEQTETAEQVDAAEQTETTEQIEVAEPAEVAGQTESGKESNETDGSTDNVSAKEKSGDVQSDDASQPQTPANETASHFDAAKKPLVIDGLVLTDAERRVFELTNIERKKRGLPALRLERRLMESARRQANWMARTGVLRHGNAGYAENIAMGQRSSREVVIDWLHSAGHFRNMMNRSHGAIGIGSYRGANGALFWCQQFSR